MNFWANLDKYKNELTPAERKVCKILEENPYPFHTFSGSKIAEMYNLPQASISRFVKKIGYDSYADFRMDLAMSEKKNVAQSGVTSSEKALTDSVSIIRQLASETLMDSLSKKIIMAHHVYLMGTGNSNVAAYQMMVKLTGSRIQSTIIPSGFEVQALHSMNKDDLCIMYSHMNPTYETFLNAVWDLPKQARPKTIMICSSKNHPLKKKVDQCVELPTFVTSNTISQANEIPPVIFNLFLAENLVKNIRDKKDKF